MALTEVTLHVHRSERADALVAPLAELLAVPPPDVFAEDVVAVPTKGVERWLAQRLGHRLGARAGRQDGVCAAIRFASLDRLVAQVSGVPAEDPWQRDRLAWVVLDVVDASAGEPWMAGLTRYLGLAGTHEGDDLRRARRLSTARRVARLFDGYAAARPAMLRAWAAGRDEDGLGEPLREDRRWQAELWRRVRDAVGGPDPVERLDRAVEDLREAAPADLPGRVSVFGATRLSVGHVDLLSALGQHTDVHLWLPHPSPALWARVTPPPVLPRRADDESGVVANPLLRTFGRDSRELQLVLSRVGLHDEHHPPPARPATLLGRLQDDVAADRAPTGAHVLGPDDRSVQVHSCHGPTRQVEVLREVVVGLLADDPSLEPRDVIVMCPDVETYAPLLAAVFGLDGIDAPDRHPGHHLRVRVADRSAAQANPLASLALRVLDMVGGRVTASDVMDLLTSEPVRERFGLGQDDVDTISDWVGDANVRWGLDDVHREPFGLVGRPENTWRAGLDRVLTGVVLGEIEGGLWAGTVPLDGVGSTSVDLAGRFAELVDRVAWAVEVLGRPQPVGEWRELLLEVLDVLASTRGPARWQRAQVEQVLGGLVTGAGTRAGTVLSSSEARALVAELFAPRASTAGFRTGGLTVCTMLPMRAVPHRVVCLLGIDDDVFPRAARVDGDDILAVDPVVGERDARSEDRQLMLDAVMAATDHLVITYTGNDERTNADRDPAVPVAELLDVLDATGTATTTATVRSQVVVRHPLQPFDARNFRAGELGLSDRPFSFDPSAVAGARAAATPRGVRPPFLAAPLPRPADRVVDLSSLRRFLARPVREFLQTGLQVAMRHEEDAVSDRMPLVLDALEMWQLRERILRLRLTGVDAATLREVEVRAGGLPPGRLGQELVDKAIGEMEEVLAAAATWLLEPQRDVDVDVDLGAGVSVSGRVRGVRRTTALTLTPSKVGSRQRVASWVDLLALTAGAGDQGWTASIVGREDIAKFAVATTTLSALDAGTARDVLADLVDVYDRGMREPLPLFAHASSVYASERRAGADETAALRSASVQWTAGQFPEGEREEHVAVWGEQSAWSAIVGDRPRADEPWSADETTRFGALARRVWDPLLGHLAGGAA